MTEQDLIKEIESLSSMVRKIVTERARTPDIATCAMVHALCIYSVASVNTGEPGVSIDFSLHDINRIELHLMSLVHDLMMQIAKIPSEGIS